MDHEKAEAKIVSGCFFKKKIVIKKQTFASVDFVPFYVFLFVFVFDLQSNSECIVHGTCAGSSVLRYGKVTTGHRQRHYCVDLPV